MRILIIYPGHSHATIDVALGYENGLRAIGHTVRAFNYHNQLTFYVGALKYWQKHAGKDDKVANPDMAALVLASEQAAIEVVDFVPDLVVVICGFVLHKRAFDLINRLCRPIVLVLTESPYNDASQARIIEGGEVAQTFTNDKSSVIPLREATGARVEYLPHSYDPMRHHKKDAVLDKYESDVFFFGTMWPERQRLLEPVRRWCRRRRIDAQIGGIGFRRRKGMITNAELVRYYSATKIALNQHRTIASAKDDEEQHVAGAYSLGPRAFEIAACKAFQLCDDARPELHEVFDGSVPTYTDGADLKNKIGYYMDHPDQREALARAAYQRVQPCSFENRARDILLPVTLEAL